MPRCGISCGSGHPGMRQPRGDARGDRVIIDIDDGSIRGGLPGDRADVSVRWDTRADVKELADAGFAGPVPVCSGSKSSLTCSNGGPTWQ